MKIYISGKITGDSNYKEKFEEAEQMLTCQGYQVVNPTCLPPFLSYEQFMEIDLLMLSYCDCIFMLSDWQDSNGAKIEYEFAKSKNIPAIFA